MPHPSAPFPPTPRTPVSPPASPTPLAPLAPLAAATATTVSLPPTIPTIPTIPTDPSIPSIPPSPVLPAPPRCEVPHFAPVRAGGVGPTRWHGAARRRMLTVALATTAAALATGLSQGPARTASAPTGCPAAAASGGR